MKEIIELVEVNSEGSEEDINIASISLKTLKIFEDDERQTAYEKAIFWIIDQPPVKLYLGSDYKVYPQIILERKYVE